MWFVRYDLFKQTCFPKTDPVVKLVLRYMIGLRKWVKKLIGPSSLPMMRCMTLQNNQKLHYKGAGCEPIVS